MADNHDDRGFLLHLHMRAQQKATEYVELLHEQRRLEIRIERTKNYVERLNDFLRDEGQEPVPLKEAALVGSGVGKPGNRSKSMPLRKAKWNGMTINQIDERILNASPDVSFHPTVIARETYEIESESDLQMVLRNTRSALLRGAKDGLWRKTGRAKFQAKITEQQGQLVNV